MKCEECREETEEIEEKYKDVLSALLGKLRTSLPNIGYKKTLHRSKIGDHNLEFNLSPAGQVLVYELDFHRLYTLRGQDGYRICWIYSIEEFEKEHGPWFEGQTFAEKYNLTDEEMLILDGRSDLLKKKIKRSHNTDFKSALDKLGFKSLPSFGKSEVLDRKFIDKPSQKHPDKAELNLYTDGGVRVKIYRPAYKWSWSDEISGYKFFTSYSVEEFEEKHGPWFWDKSFAENYGLTQSELEILALLGFCDRSIPTKLDYL